MNTVNYQDLVDLDFKPYQMHDNVIFKESGVHPFLMTKKIRKGLKMEWYSMDRTCRIMNLDSQDNIKFQKRNLSIEEIKSFINLLKKYP